MRHLKSNGFGSFQQLIAVWVDKLHLPCLLSLPGVELLDQPADRALVQYPLWSTRPDDDETVVYELRYRFTGLGVPFEDWSIDWERSAY
ncbi:MAG: hypothetical protein V2I51_22720 [Anderseniella sp.]|jgi:hypothetical protein|nr:hypothetical protein [Anderseniella sp.]